MPTNIKILSPNEINSFDQPPALDANQRKMFFRPSKAAQKTIDSLRTSMNKIGFVLQYGYFMATNKFFEPKNFLKSEIDFVCSDYNVSPESVDFNHYDENTPRRHQKTILELLGTSLFTDETKSLLKIEALKLCSAHMKPRAILFNLVDFLIEKRIEVPSYNALAIIITEAINEYEGNLVSSISKAMTQEDKALLDNLLKGKGLNLDLLENKLSSLKRNFHSLRPLHIKSNLKDFLYFKKLFEQLEPVIKRLNLDIPTIQYYAGLVIKSTTFQMLQRDGVNRYLLLICFLMHKYYSLNDLLIDALIQACHNARNTALRKHKDYSYDNRQQKEAFTEKAIETIKLTFQDIKDVLFNQQLSDAQKISVLQAMFLKQPESNDVTIDDKIAKIESDYERIKDDKFYDFLEESSIKLQNRVSEIIKHIEFDRETSDPRILEAIDYYKRKDGALGQDASVDFLSPEQESKLWGDNNKFRVSLYKVFFFHEIASAIKSGALNLLHSYKYLAFDKYLISKKAWAESRQSFLERSGLIRFENLKEIINDLDRVLNKTFEQTNKNIINEKNDFVSIGPSNNLIVVTPAVYERDISEAQIADLFPQERYFSLFEVLSTVNKATGFLNNFEHWKTKMHWKKPDEKTFFAGIIGLGCNLGVRKIARISSNISLYSLENTVNWYFSNDNINNANNKILSLIDKLNLSHIYQKNQNMTHTSSDGQKFGVGVDSIHAQHSFKYFGQGKGISCYTFIDELHRLFYSTVISPTEREAAYVIDGLMQNEVVKSDIHSTDTHGYTEVIFAVCHLLGIQFAPRIKDFRDQRLYSIQERSIFKALGYKIIPYRKIDTEFVADEWDNILRLVATIKLKHTTASQLFQRLSHYSRQHPLYRAVKSFGRIIKTIFLLKYIDSVELRQTIEKQLNKIESSQKFAKAVFFGSNQEFQYKTKEDQIRADGCKRLIENAIICWNYLYLSDLILKTKDLDERQRIIKIVKGGSVVAWQHINLQGLCCAQHKP